MPDSGPRRGGSSLKTPDRVKREPRRQDPHYVAGCGAIRMTIRVGVCGLGAMGLLFTQLLHHHPAVGEVPVAELDGGLRQLLNDSGLVSRSLESFDQLVDSDLDAVAIFTPPWQSPD